MMLNEFIDKALEAAKKSIAQIYGEYYSGLKNAIQNDEAGNRNEGVEKDHLLSERNDHHQHTLKKIKQQEQLEQFNAKLESIREYAANQIDLSLDELTHWRSKENKDSATPSGSSLQFYSRKDLQTSAPKPQNKTSTIGEFLENKRNGENSTKQINTIVDRYIDKDEQHDESKPENNKNHLHSRLDKLESLMHLTLSSSESDYSGHPLFHKLLQKGVPAKMINEWFDTLVEQGINPNKQRALFRSKMAVLIQDLLETSAAGVPAKNLLFTGRSGVGKTTLIMKMSRSKSMRNKKIAAVSLTPQNVSNHKYSILGPYCKDHDIPYWNITSADEFERLSERWKSFDHVLIDTPFLEESTNNIMAEILAVQKRVNEPDNIETHFVIDTAIHGMVFNDPLKSEINADYLALTKIDKATKWGKTIQLIANTDCTIRYISNGASLSSSLIAFDPQKAAQILLQ